MRLMNDDQRSPSNTTKGFEPFDLGTGDFSREILHNVSVKTIMERDIEKESMSS